MDSRQKQEEDILSYNSNIAELDNLCNILVFKIDDLKYLGSEKLYEDIDFNRGILVELKEIYSKQLKSIEEMLRIL